RPGARESMAICAAAILLQSRANRFGTRRKHVRAQVLPRYSAAESQLPDIPADSSQSRPARAAHMPSSRNLGVISVHSMRPSLVLSTLGAKYGTLEFES